MNELGKFLKEQREEKGITLDELQDITKIQRRYLVGIENGNYSLMPGPFYVRAFIKQYVEAIGLKSDEIFEQFKDDIPASLQEESPVNLSRVQSRNTFSSNSKVFEFLPKVLIGLFIIGIVATAYYFFVLYDNNTEETPEVVTDPSVTIVDSGKLDQPATPEEEEVTPPVEQVPTEPEQPEYVQELVLTETVGNKSYFDLKGINKFELELATTGQTWVSVTNNKGYSFYEGTLNVNGTEKLKQFDFSNEEEIVIIMGRPSETTVTINGEPINLSTITSGTNRHDLVIRYVFNAQ